MNRVMPLTFKKPYTYRNQKILDGDIIGESVDFFVIEYNPGNSMHHLLVKDSVPVHLRGPYQWYMLVEGSLDFCYGYLLGKYKETRIKYDNR